MTYEIYTKGKGWKKIAWKELSLKAAEKLEYAGTSVETRPYKPIPPVHLHKPRKGIDSLISRFAEALGANKIISPHETEDLSCVLSSLHARAIRNLESKGYSAHDIAGYVIMTPQELEEYKQPTHSGEIHGAKYYFKPGKGSKN